MAKAMGPSPFLYIASAETIETYESGASTITQATYHDSELRIRQVQPLPDVGGWQRSCYLDSGTQYRFVIKDIDGATLHTIDNIAPILPSGMLYADINVNGNAIASTSAGNLVFTPDPLGSIVMDGLSWPQGDGASTAILGTNGVGNMVWLFNGSEFLPDTTPQLGGNLDTNGYNIFIDDGKSLTDDSGNMQIKFNALSGRSVNYTAITNAATGTGVTLGVEGEDTDIALQLNAKGTGNIIINGFKFPNSEGATNQGLVTDGSKNLIFSDRASITATDMVDGTSSTLAITPALQHYHKSAAKAFYRSAVGIYNIASVVASSQYSGTGVGGTNKNYGTTKTFYFENEMADSSYVVACVYHWTRTLTISPQYHVQYLKVHTKTPASFKVTATEISRGEDVWPATVSLIVYGNLVT